MAFYRRPSPLELTYIAADKPDYSPYVNQYFAEGEGDLDLASLKKAVAAAAAVVPETRLALKGHWGFRYWDDAGPLPQVSSIDASQWDGLSGTEAPILGARINVWTGPVCEVVLMEGTPRRILFRTHHACTDGAGTLFFMRQVFRFLRGEPLETPNSRITEWEVAQQEGPVEKTVKSGNCRPVFKNMALSYEGGCIWRRFLFPSKPAGIGGKIMSIVTALAKAQDIEKVLFRVPSNLRRYLPKEEFTASNCTGILDIDAAEAKTPQKMQQLIIGAMRNKQDLAMIKPATKWFHWLPFSMLRTNDRFNKAVHEKGVYSSTCMTTNMGMVDYREYECEQFKSVGMFGVPIPLELTPLYISFFQSEQGTWIHLGIPRSLGNEEDLRKLQATITERLLEIEKKVKTTAA